MVTVTADRGGRACSTPLHEDVDGAPTREHATGPAHRALAILELLGADEVRGPLGVVEIARLLGREKSQISRSLRLLDEPDPVTQRLDERVEVSVRGGDAGPRVRRMRRGVDEPQRRSGARRDGGIQRARGAARRPAPRRPDPHGGGTS